MTKLFNLLAAVYNSTQYHVFLQFSIKSYIHNIKADF